MDKTIFLDLSESITEKTADFISKNFSPANKIAVVSGGRRPSLFIKRHMFQKKQKPFFSPSFFSNDEFMHYLAARRFIFGGISELDACYEIYESIKKPGMPAGLPGNSFPEFLPWAKEILSILERSDLENISGPELKNIENLAGIGYSVPEALNGLLASVAQIRESFHGRMEEKKLFTRGFTYLKAAQTVKSLDLDEFEAVIFCGLFYLHRTEIDVIKDLISREKAVLIFQGSPDDWSVLAETFSALDVSGKPSRKTSKPLKLTLHASPDLHSEIASVRQELEETGAGEDTVIMLPEPSSLVPLAYELSTIAGECNISVGYPVQRSMFYSLVSGIVKVMGTSMNGLFYSDDYLKVLGHPFVKNLSVEKNKIVSRIIIHKVEETLKGLVESSHSGKKFISTAEIESSGEILCAVKDALSEESVEAKDSELVSIIKNLHGIVFDRWEMVDSFASLASALDVLVEAVMNSLDRDSHPVEAGAAKELLKLKNEMDSASFSRVPIERGEIFKIFLDSVKSRRISLAGVPLKGLQILGFLETRLLKFKNVIIIDLNEGVLPALKMYEPLIPSEVLRILKIKDLAKEEQTQKYHFRRLIESADNVHLFYIKNDQKQRSRFIEDIVWQQEKKLKKLNPFPEIKAAFNLEIRAEGPRPYIEKTSGDIARLADLAYSASGLNTYINCPLSYYFKYIQGLEESEDLLSEPGGVDVGRFVHDLLEHTFQRFVGRELIIDDEFRKYFGNYFKKFFKKYFENRLGNSSFMLERVIEHRMEKFLDAESARKCSGIVSLEEKLTGSVPAGGIEAKLTARVDRTDRLSASELLIIDYKTGSGESLPSRKALEQPLIRSRELVKKLVRSVQLPLYCFLAGKKHPGQKINAAVYDLRAGELKLLFKENEDFDGKIELFTETIKNIISEILDPDIPFTASDAGSPECRYCPYAGLCK